MEKKERVDVEQCVSATARLALWLVGDIEPESKGVVEADLDLLYELAVAIERRARDKYPDWQ